MDNSSEEMTKSRFTVLRNQAIEPQPHHNEDFYHVVSSYYRVKKSVVYKKFIFLFLDKAQTQNAMPYTIISFLIFMIIPIINLAIIRDKERPSYQNFAFGIVGEIFILTYVSVELALSIWSCTVSFKYKKNRSSYLLKYTSFIDYLIVLWTLCTIIMFSINFITGKLRIWIPVFHAINFLRVLHFEKRTKGLYFIYNIMAKHRRELMSVYFMVVILFTSFSIIMYFVEMNDELIVNKVPFIIDSFYFSVISFLTVGYGDLKPKTDVGKLLTMTFSLFCVAICAVPAGIIGSGLAIQLTNRDKKKGKILNRRTSVNLIQALYRFYSIKKFGLNSAVFKRNFLAYSSYLEYKKGTKKRLGLKKPITNIKIADFAPTECNTATITVNRGAKFTFEKKISISHAPLKKHLILLKFLFKLIFFGLLKARRENIIEVKPVEEVLCTMNKSQLKMKKRTKLLERMILKLNLKIDTVNERFKLIEKHILKTESMIEERFNKFEIMLKK